MLERFFKKLLMENGKIVIRLQKKMSSAFFPHYDYNEYVVFANRGVLKCVISLLIIVSNCCSFHSEMCHTCFRSVENECQNDIS